MACDEKEPAVSSADQGGLQFRVGVDGSNKLVIVEFGAPVKWLALTADETVRLSEILLEKVSFMTGGLSGEHVVVGSGQQDRADGDEAGPSDN